MYDDDRDKLCLIFACHLEFFVHLGHLVTFPNFFLVEVGHVGTIISDLPLLHNFHYKKLKNSSVILSHNLIQLKVDIYRCIS